MSYKGRRVPKIAGPNPPVARRKGGQLSRKRVQKFRKIKEINEGEENVRQKVKTD